MKDEDLQRIIVGQHVTEKGSKALVNNQYIFKVQKAANKVQVKKAVEKVFNVKVAAVKILNVMGKERRFGQITGRKSDWKKAYVSLLEGYSINLPGSEQMRD